MTATVATEHTDPNAKIPKAARLASEKADALHKSLYATPPKEEPAADGPKPEATAAPAEAPASPSTQEATPPAAEAPAEPGPGAEPAAQPTPTGEDWEHRYNSMKGRYDRAEDRIKQLTARIASLEGDLAAAKLSAPSQAPSVEPLITPQELQDYGEEFLTVVGKKAKEIAAAETSELRSQVADLTAKLTAMGGTITQTAQEKMYELLDRDVPSWQQINVDPNFIAWLQLPDTYSGAIRHTLLKEAFERNDSPRVLAFFKGFLTEEAAVAPAPRVEEPAPAAPAPGKVPLETLAAPGRAKSPAATPAPVEKPIISRAQIAKFYADVTAGKYRGKEAEKDRLEKMIFEAERDGRIR